MRVVVLGAEQDLSIWDAICEHLTDEAKHGPVSMVGKLSLSEVKALCQRATMFVGTDNGIMHISDALGTPCVALFATTELRFWHPWQSLHIAVRPCADAFRDWRNCTYYGTEPGCIAQISEDQILSAVRDMEEMLTYCPKTS
jgi:ADP-heptose:LPS heptosyltransferase